MAYTNPYFNNPYQSFNPYMQPTQENYQNQLAQYQQRVIGLQGKIVDSLEVVKATDIPFGTVSYFPLADGSAIATKQWNMDGTSRTTVYKPVEDTPIQQPKFVTEQDLDTLRKELTTLKERIDSYEHTGNNPTNNEIQQ